MMDDSMYFTLGIIGLFLAATVLVIGFTLGEIVEIVIVGAILLLLSPVVLVWPALGD